MEGIHWDAGMQRVAGRTNALAAHASYIPVTATGNAPGASSRPCERFMPNIPAGSAHRAMATAAHDSSMLNLSIL